MKLGAKTPKNWLKENPKTTLSKGHCIKWDPRIATVTNVCAGRPGTVWESPDHIYTIDISCPCDPREPAATPEKYAKYTPLQQDYTASMGLPIKIGTSWLYAWGGSDSRRKWRECDRLNHFSGPDTPMNLARDSQPITRARTVAPSQYASLSHWVEGIWDGGRNHYDNGIYERTPEIISI